MQVVVCVCSGRYFLVKYFSPLYAQCTQSIDHIFYFPQWIALEPRVPIVSIVPSLASYYWKPLLLSFCYKYKYEKESGGKYLIIIRIWKPIWPMQISFPFNHRPAILFLYILWFVDWYRDNWRPWVEWLILGTIIVKCLFPNNRTFTFQSFLAIFFTFFEKIYQIFFLREWN